MENFNFEFFNPNTGTISISLANYGITFSRGAVDTLGCPEYIAIAFDKGNKLIAFKKVNKDNEHKMPFGKKLKGGYVRINNKSLIRQIEALFSKEFGDKSIRYFTYWNDEHNMLIADLKRQLDDE